VSFQDKRAAAGSLVWYIDVRLLILMRIRCITEILEPSYRGDPGLLACFKTESQVKNIFLSAHENMSYTERDRIHPQLKIL
jgi:hypothetical protein